MTGDGPRRFEVVETREAWLVTPTNLDAVAEWCGGTVLDEDDPAVACVQYPHRFGDGFSRGVAYVGDVLIRDTRGFTHTPEWLFERDLAPRWREVASSGGRADGHVVSS